MEFHRLVLHDTVCMHVLVPHCSLLVEWETGTKPLKENMEEGGCHPGDGTDCSSKRQEAAGLATVPWVTCAVWCVWCVVCVVWCVVCGVCGVCGVSSSRIGRRAMDFNASQSVSLFVPPATAIVTATTRGTDTKDHGHGRLTGPRSPTYRCVGPMTPWRIHVCMYRR